MPASSPCVRMLTRDDPRHRRNLVLPRYHSGGEIGLGPDEVSSSMTRIQSAAHLSGEMGKKAAEAANPVVNVNSINVLDPVEILNEALRRPGGSEAVLNWMTANRRKVKGL